MNRSFLVHTAVVFVIFLLLSSQTGYATRFLPMIVWDHMNPLVTCKCNWLTIPKVDVYDQVDFVCPSLKISVKLLDGVSRPTSEMNENLFMRTWKGSEDDLREQLQNGTFCDPTKADKKYTCRNGDGDKSYVASFKSSQETHTLVYFNNANDGKATSLNSKEAKCTMVFAAKIVYDKKKHYDMSYGKCLDPNGNICDDVKGNCSLNHCKLRPTTPPTTQPPETTTPNTTRGTPNTTSDAPPSQSPTSRGTYPDRTTKTDSSSGATIRSEPNRSPRCNDDKIDWVHALVLGIAVGTVIGLLVGLALRRCKYKIYSCNTDSVSDCDSESQKAQELTTKCQPKNGPVLMKEKLVGSVGELWKSKK